MGGCGCKKKKTEQVQTTTNTNNQSPQINSIQTKEEDKAKVVSEIIKKLNMKKP